MFTLSDYEKKSALFTALAVAAIFFAMQYFRGISPAEAAGFPGPAAEIRRTSASGSAYDGHLPALRSVRSGEYVPIRVLLSTANKYGADISSPEKMLLSFGTGRNYRTNSVKIRMQNGKTYVTFGKIKLRFEGKVTVFPTKRGQYMEISDWNRVPAWSKDGKVNDNKFL